MSNFTQVNFICYLQGAITGILFAAVAHAFILGSLEVKVSSKSAEKCITSGGEITKVRAGGQVICRTFKK